jgi:ABC-type sugar transport system ATPase subunit
LPVTNLSAVAFASAPSGVNAVLSLENITKTFPGVVALSRVSLEIQPGTVHALTGENGSGKSTLARIVNGSLSPDSGRVLIDGAPVRFSGPADALRAGIVTISQEITLASDLTVAENIGLGGLPQKGRGVVDWAEVYAQARRVLGYLAFDIDPRAKVKSLSLERQQQVEIARAVSRDAKILILDEATSSLSEAAARRLLEVVEQRRRSGSTVLMISHRLPEVYSAASVASVLRDGRHVATVDLADTREQALVSLMVGRELGDYYGKRELPIGDVVMTATGLATPDGLLAPTSLSVRAGEILGVAGLVGSGKSEFGQALGGATEAIGTLEVAGKRVKLGSPTSARHCGIGFVPDDRKKSALLLNRSVKENFSLAWQDRIAPRGRIRAKHEQRLVGDAVARHGVVTRSTSAVISTLSGGNQQKVVLGRTLDLDPKVLVLNEPTRGIDIGAKSEIYRLLQSAATRGAGVILISSELPELLGVCDRIVVFYRGKIVDEFARAEATEEMLAHAAVSGYAREHVQTSFGEDRE